MNLRTVKTIFKKEMLDTVRDKRTLIMMIGVPVLLYPVLVIVGMQGALVQIAHLDESVSRVALRTDEKEIVRTWLEDVEKIEIVETGSPEEDLHAGKLEAVVSIDGPVAGVIAQGKSVEVNILYDSTEFESSGAAERLRFGLGEDGDTLLDTRLAALNIDKDYIEPLTINRDDVAPPAKTTGNALGIVLPVLMVVMLALGAFYPAVDVTAGEKERGTFETLLSTPTTKLEIVTGKFFTVFLLAMATGLLNLGSMAATFAFVAKQLGPVLGDSLQFDLNFPPSAFFVFLIIMVPLAFFISAIMMAVAVFARSFKEAQNYVTPFFLFLMVPVFYSSMPGVKLNATTQFLPITNVILLFRDMMTGKAGFESTFAVFLSTTAFAALALLFAAWLFQREEVILSDEKGFPLTWRRSEFRPRPAITAFMAMGLFTILLISMFFVGSLIQGWRPLPGLLITQWLMLLLPVLLLLWYVKVDLRKSLHLQRLNPTDGAATVLIGVSIVLLALQMNVWLSKVLTAPEGVAEAMGNMLTGDSPLQVFFILVVAAFSPAICEEVLFRGAILSGLRTRLNPWAAVVVVGVLFGLFHLYIFRIPTTAALGMVLTYLVVRTGSIYAAMIVHFLNNAFGLLLLNEKMPSWLTDTLNIEQAEEMGLPWPVLIAAFIGVVIGVALLEWRARHRAA